MRFITRRRTRLNVLGIVILAAGLSISGVICWHNPQTDSESDEDVLLMQEQSKAYERAVERNVGSFGLLMSRGSAAIARLGQPRPLAIIIVLVSCLTAGGLFHAASRQGD